MDKAGIITNVIRYEKDGGKDGNAKVSNLGSKLLERTKEALEKGKKL